jgi:hypothetical protein
MPAQDSSFCLRLGQMHEQRNAVRGKGLGPATKFI